MWFNPKVKPHAYTPEQSLKSLQGTGFRWSGGRLYDSRGNQVEFSLITNSGNKARARIASLLSRTWLSLGFA